MEWVRKNKLSAFLLLVIALVLFGKSLVSMFFGVQTLQLNLTPYESSGAPGGLTSTGVGSARKVLPAPVPESDYAPSESEERMVVRETSMSLVVKSVRESVDGMIGYVERIGGYMVSSSLTKPEEAPYAQVVVRVPSDKLNEALEYLRNLSVKVSSEYIQGRDVTDQYEDIQSRLASHQKVKAKFEETLEKATKVQDILTVQRELINVQTQIDNLKGRQKYLEQTARLAKITAHLSTDEWSLPYTPAKPFRPGVIFKQAVRSLILTLRGLAEKLIWLVVYSVVWGPVLVLVVWWKRRKKRVGVDSAS